jgi:anti-sigma factor RsiW
MGFERSEETMGISCEEVWLDISDYIDEDLDPVQRASLDQHFAECRHCTALLEGTRNVIGLYRDERLLAPPDGFHERLYQRLGETTKTSRRSFLAWTLTAAAAVPLGLALFSVRRMIIPAREPQSPASGSDERQVAETVAISQDQDDKVYHVAAGCSHLHGKPKFLTVKEAVREGYAPCVYCIGKTGSKKDG